MTPLSGESPSFTNAAAEQLGSEKAPVRLTALYTLERLAGDNPPHQQTIVNIICAYLRMPYDPPRTARAVRRRVTRADLAAGAGQAAPDPREERQVRLTAQRILATHLHSEAPAHWANIDLDLTGATLTDFALSGCTLRTADFGKANFTGDANFGGTKLTGTANFCQANFTGDARFEGATFGRGAYFIGATSPALPASLVRTPGTGRPSGTSPTLTERPSSAPPTSAGQSSLALPTSVGRG